MLRKGKPALTFTWFGPHSTFRNQLFPPPSSYFSRRPVLPSSGRGRLKRETKEKEAPLSNTRLASVFQPRALFPRSSHGRLPSLDLLPPSLSSLDSLFLVLFPGPSQYRQAGVAEMAPLCTQPPWHAHKAEIVFRRGKLTVEGESNLSLGFHWHAACYATAP